MNQDELIPLQKLVPAGKHKGKPLAALLGDQEARQWWLDHPKMGAAYPFVIQFITNTCEASPTPVHNLFQIEFLNEDIRRKTYSLFAQERLLKRAIFDISLRRQSEDNSMFLAYSVSVAGPRFEHTDVSFGGVFFFECRFNVAPVCKHSNNGGLWWLADEDRDDALRRFPYFVQFEEKEELKAELKPLLGNDYPDVLRKMISKKGNCLIYDAYDGCISEDDLKLFFWSQRIVVLRKSDIVSVHCPIPASRIGW